MTLHTHTLVHRTVRVFSCGVYVSTCVRHMHQFYYSGHTNDSLVVFYSCAVFLPVQIRRTLRILESICLLKAAGMDLNANESQEDRRNANQIRQALVIQLKECEPFFEMMKDNPEHLRHFEDYKLICGSLSTE